MRWSPHPVTLRQLQYIVAVADHHSFRKAARACAVSQPSLSAQVAQVEGVLGLRLFERDTTRVRITEAGRGFVEKARVLLSSMDALVDGSMRAADPLAGTLRLSVIPTVAPYLLPELANPLRQAFPRLRFTWVEERTPQLARRLRDAELDGALVALETDALDDVQSLVLGRDPFVLATAVGHALARAVTPVQASALEDEQVLVLEDGHCFGEQVAQVCQRARAAEVDVRATSLSTLSQMVVGGLGITLLPSLALGVENRLGSLHLRPFAAKGPARTLALVWRKGAAAQDTLRAIAPVVKKTVEAALSQALPRFRG